jgi:hypothetical protein
MGLQIASGGTTIGADAAIVTVLWGLVALGGVPALMPYARARKLRAESK